MAKTKTKPAAGPKPKSDAYVMMMFITLLAIGIGCTLLYLDYDEYGKQTAPTEKVPALPAKLGTDPGTGATTPPGDGGGGAVTPPGGM